MLTHSLPGSEAHVRSFAQYEEKKSYFTHFLKEEYDHFTLPLVDH
jgi:hypothetical protein